jgi:hypothetical protein
MRSDSLYKCSELQRQRSHRKRNACFGLHLHLRHWLLRNDLQRLRSELYWLPRVQCSTMHEQRQLQRQGSFREWDASIRMYLHLRHGLLRNDLQRLCSELYWLPHVQCSTMHKRRSLQRQSSFREWGCSIRLHLHLRYWLLRNDLQLMRSKLSRVPIVHGDSVQQHRQLQQQRRVG